jgi:PKD repeat protein
MAEMERFIVIKRKERGTWLLPAIIIVLCGLPVLAGAVITCPSGWSCISRADATARWPGGFDQYSGEACSVDVDFQTYSYCYRQIGFITCPSAATCMSDSDAQNQPVKYAKILNMTCGMDPDLVPYFCYVPVTPLPTVSPVKTVSYNPRVNVTVYPVWLPVARFSYRSPGYSTPMPPPYWIDFDATSSTSPYGITAYRWNFGDGSPEGSSGNPFIGHQYSGPGSYTVTLRITDRATPPQEDTTSQTISVAPSVPPVADFTVSNESGPAPLLVVFTDTSAGNPNGWEWQFSGIENLPTIVSRTLPPALFTQPGTENVRLTVSNQYGISSRDRTITVTSAPQPTCTPPGCLAGQMPRCPTTLCPGNCGLVCGVPDVFQKNNTLTIEAIVINAIWDCPDINDVILIGFDGFPDTMIHLRIRGPGLPEGGVPLADAPVSSNHEWRFDWHPTFLSGYNVSRGNYTIMVQNQGQSKHSEAGVFFGDALGDVYDEPITPYEDLTWGQPIHIQGYSGFCNESDVHLRIYGPGLPEEGVLFATPPLVQPYEYAQSVRNWNYDWDPSEIPGYEEQIGTYAVYAWNDGETSWVTNYLHELHFTALAPETGAGANPLNQVASTLFAFIRSLLGLEGGASGETGPPHITPTITQAETTPPTASFTALPIAGKAPLKVIVDATGSRGGTSPITSYAWDFGDGYTGYGPTGSHTYPSAGNYTIRLTVTDSKQISDFTSRKVVVTESISPAGGGKPPVAQFTVNPSSGTVPLVTMVDASGSYDPDGTVVAYRWNFGDGSSGTGISGSHTYASAGDYAIQLTVQDNSGLSIATARRVEVRSVVTTTTKVPPQNNLPPLAAIDLTPISGFEPLTVSFSATRSRDPDGTIVSYAWDFGDGQTGNGSGSSHVFGKAGAYTVTLTVTDNQGATGQTTGQVVVVTDLYSHGAARG